MIGSDQKKSKLDQFKAKILVVGNWFKSNKKRKLLILFVLVLLISAGWFAGKKIFTKPKSGFSDISNISCDVMTLVALKKFDQAAGVKPVFGEKCQISDDRFFLKLTYEDSKQAAKAKLAFLAANSQEMKTIESYDLVSNGENSSVFILNGQKVGVLVLTKKINEAKLKEEIKIAQKLLEENKQISGLSLPTSQKAENCQTVNLDQDYQNYYLTKESTPCLEYAKNFSGNEVKIRCQQSNAQWRDYLVKEIETGRKDNLRVKADLGLIDYEKFFTESGGVGVKYDDYVQLMVVSQDPRVGLGSECGRAVSEGDWAKYCLIKEDSTAILGKCGVSKFTDSKKCDFLVNTSGLDKLYLVFKVVDVWAADVEGNLSNLNICAE